MSRTMALEFVRGLLESGYTAERADRESHLGFDACDGSGRSYVIQHGRMQVPYRGDGQKFSFRALVQEVLAMPMPQKPPPVSSTRCEQLTLI